MAGDRKPSEWMIAVGRYSSLAFLIPVATLVGYGIGYWLDGYFGTRFLTPLFLILGIAAALTNLIRAVNKETPE
ncbi:MAG: AtpZ/AtpI family protein [Bryobacteraceae bacterium]|nr:AtpZ/AtpI family protein [Bryobacteraceae bacterium]